LLALALVLQERYADAEPLVREALASEQTQMHRRFQWMSVLGAVFLGQQKFDDAEPHLLKGFYGLKQREVIHPALRRRVNQAGEWTVRLYEETGQPEKARLWRGKLSTGKTPR
jgi:hypothetical protein